MRKLLLIVLSFTMVNGLMAQENYWASHKSTGTINTDKAVSRATFPKEFKLFDLNIEPLKKQLLSVTDNQSSRHSAVISLPNADGQIEQFEVIEASNFDARLQAQFPAIRAFSGKGITDRFATLKLSVSPQGIQTMIFRAQQENEFIEAYSREHAVYAVFKSHRKAGQLPWSCNTLDRKFASDLNGQVGTNPTMEASGTSTGQLKTMRLAQSVTAEYSNYFGATSASQVGLVLAGINATLTRCNGVYEKDLAVHLNLVASSTNVIYYNASTDPYDVASTGAGGSWNAQLQSTLTSVIGEANYDIGHLFGASGGGGNAGCIGCVCSNGSKGSGFTSPADAIPQGDNFDIDYVVHEVGHQMGANHTFSMSNENTGVNKEIGSGITIMGYAGITSQDVAPHSIDIFHEASIAQIQANLATKTCPVSTNISANNAAPVIGAVSNYTIPISTPFALTGSATDANADALTYCWEQNDNSSASQTGTKSIASATKASGPNWISFRPSTSATRNFPQLSTILAGALTTGPLPGGDAGTTIEALSSVSRALNFRLTVRDNAAYSSSAPIKVAQTAFTDVVVTVSNSSGPFAVTSPNSALTFAGGSTQTITWSVASTTASPVSCANVKVSLSTDGGLTFPTVLIASTPNDGTQALVIPNTATTTARVKVEAVGNIFFDISNTNFTITNSVNCGDATGLASSSIGNNTATVSWSAAPNAVSYAVDYKLNSTSTWTSFSTAQSALSANLTGLTPGALYDWRVRATCTSGVGNYVAAQFTTTAPFVCNAPSGLAASSITSSGATVSWGAVSGAASYAVDYKLNTAAIWTSATASTVSTSVSISGLSSSSLYDYRVSTNCGANGSSGFSAAQFTTSAPFVCNAPSGLAASSITSSGATVSWGAVSGGASYAVDYKLNTSATWTSATASTASTSVSISGLVASSLYDYRVSTNCGANGSSGFSAAQFTTSAPFVCNAPSGLIASSITSTGATVSWGAVSGAASYAVDYKLNTSGTWTIATASTASTSIPISGLTAASLYDYRVSTNCGANGSSGFSTAQFTTSTASTCATAFEANETLATAAAITSAVTNSAAISTSTDIDYYKIVTTATSNIVYNLVGPSGVDYDLTIYNSAGTQIGTSAGATATETVSLSSQSAGTYYIKVFGYNGANSATCYTIKATATTVTSCQSTYDVSTNGTISGAASIPFNTNITGLVSPSADIDDYKFVITTAGTITLTLTTLPADYDLRLLNSAGTQVAISQNGSTTGETINYTAAAGTYYAQVYGYNNANNATSCYTLKVALGTATRVNETPLFSSKKVLSVYPNPVQNKLFINLTGYKGVSEISLYDINGKKVNAGRTAETNSQMDIGKLSKGMYLLKVVTASGETLNTKVIKQ
jgi:hypothetical protein